MALQHRTHPTFGVQFHPESILTERGHQLLANFLGLIEGRQGRHAGRGAAVNASAIGVPPNRSV